MTREFLSIDFYGNELIAVVAAFDEETDSLRVRCALRRPCKAFAGAFVRDMEAARQELSSVFEEIARYVSNSLSVVIGLRGSFLSFKRSSGFQSVSSRNRIIGNHEIEVALQNSIPNTLNETLEVIDILPQSYTIDGNIGITNPKGMSGFTLEVETFLSLAVVTHLNTLHNVLTSCECNEYQVLPSVVALGSQLVSPEDQQTGTLLLDIGESITSALMYYKGALVEAWELPFGTDRLVQAVADLLQNDLETTKNVLKTYEPGTDEIVDDILETSAEKLLISIKRELLQSLIYLQHPSTQLVICGAAADKTLLKSCKKAFGARKARLAAYEDLMTDCGNADHPAYAGALSLISHALEREQQQLGVTKSQERGLFGGLLNKLGFSELFSDQ